MKSMADLYETDIRSKILVASFSPIFLSLFGVHKLVLECNKPAISSLVVMLSVVLFTC